MPTRVKVVRVGERNSIVGVTASSGHKHLVGVGLERTEPPGCGLSSPE